MSFNDSVSNFLLSQLSQTQNDIPEIINTFNFPVILLSKDNTIVEINDVALNIINFTGKLLKGLCFLQVSTFFSDQQALLTHYLTQAQQTNDTVEFVQEIRNSLGETYDIQWKTLPLQKKQHSVNIILLGKVLHQIKQEDIEQFSLAQFRTLNPFSTTGAQHDSQELFSAAHEYDVISQIIQNLPGCSYIKDLEYRYLEGNDYMINTICGFLTKQDLVGKDDYFLNKSIGSRWPEDLYHSIRLDDELVIKQGQPIINKKEPPFLSTNGQVVIQSATKIPLLDKKQNPIGLFGVSIDISNTISPVPLYHLYQKMHITKQKAHFNFLTHVLQVDKDSALHHLTIGEMNCMLQFSTGMTAKGIAKVMNISPRTVEMHMANAKEKMGCHTKLELNQYLVKKSCAHYQV